MSQDDHKMAAALHALGLQWQVGLGSKTAEVDPLPGC